MAPTRRWIPATTSLDFRVETNTGDGLHSVMPAIRTEIMASTTTTSRRPVHRPRPVPAPPVLRRRPAAALRRHVRRHRHRAGRQRRWVDTLHGVTVTYDANIICDSAGNNCAAGSRPPRAGPSRFAKAWCPFSTASATPRCATTSTTSGGSTWTRVESQPVPNVLQPRLQAARARART